MALWHLIEIENSMNKIGWIIIERIEPNRMENYIGGWIIKRNSEKIVVFDGIFDGLKELELIKESGWKEFPPRLPEQPIFYPVMNEEYAAQIAEQWNVRDNGAGFVTKFAVDSEYLSKIEIQNVGGKIHNELWVPAEELYEFNQHIVELIEVTQEFH